MIITGADASNYTLTQPVGLAANITAKPLTVDATGANKVYDGNTTDRVMLASNGVVSGDSISFTNNSANFSTASVGNAKTVTVNGIQVTGTDAALQRPAGTG